MRPHTALVICTLPRSGSYMLCDGLNQTGQLGLAAEYYSIAQRLFYEQLIGAERVRNYDIVFDTILRLGRTPNGVFAAKVLFHQLATLRANFDACNQYPGWTPVALLDRLLPSPRYLHLIRRDKLRQAISYHRAIGSGIWWQFDARAPSSGARAPAYDHHAIRHWLTTMTLWDEAWAAMLAEVRGPVLTMYYDDVVRDYPAAMREVFSLVGVAAPANLAEIKPQLKKQSDATTEAWVRRFHEIEAAKAPVPALAS